MNQVPPSVPTAETIGRYEVLEEIGRGSMGVVLLAHDPVLGRRVAVKYLRPDLKLDDEGREVLMKRMRQESRAVARISHPGIIALHDIGEDPVRGTFLVFEHAKGPTLQAVLERGRLTKEGTARLAREMGEALDSAHSHSVLHRDIKPGNVILTEEGSRIADFGVARLPDSTLTKAGARLGTPAYSSPEAVRSGEHTERSDQFSMAACLYEGLSGRRAFPGDDAMKVARAIETEPPLPIAEALGLNERVDQALFQAMSIDGRQRFSSCREFGAALSEALLGVREGQPTLPDEQMILRIDSREKKRALGHAILWLLIGATLATAAFQLRSPEPPIVANTETSIPPLRPATLSLSPKKGK